MVPPNCGCGCANTTAARIASPAAPAGSSSTASSVPAGPARSVMVGMRELTHEPGEVLRTRHEADVTGSLHLYVLDAGNEVGVPPRHVNRHHPIELLLA